MTKRPLRYGRNTKDRLLDLVDYAASAGANIDEILDEYIVVPMPR